MRSLLLLLLLFVPVVSSAFVAVVTDQSQPYETVPVEATLEEERFFLGELSGYPIMYEVVAEEPFTFTAQVRQPANKLQQPFTLLLIRKNDRGGGVSEVTRMDVDPAEWTRERDGEIGLSLSQSPVISEQVEPGVYRLEISTSENLGKYMLQIGSVPSEVGYTDQLAAVRTTQVFFGYGLLAMLGSTLVFYPIGCILLLFLLYKTWQYRQVFRNPSSHASA